MSNYRVVGGDVGTQIVFTVREWPIGSDPNPNTPAPILNISGATNLKLILTPPPGILSQGVAQNTVTASLYSDGTDGKLKYTTVSGDIPAVPPGAPTQVWTARPMFTLGGWTGKGEPDTFFVDG